MMRNSRPRGASVSISLNGSPSSLDVSFLAITALISMAALPILVSALRSGFLRFFRSSFRYFTSCRCRLFGLELRNRGSQRHAPVINPSVVLGSCRPHFGEVGHDVLAMTGAFHPASHDLQHGLLAVGDIFAHDDVRISRPLDSLGHGRLIAAGVVKPLMLGHVLGMSGRRLRQLFRELERRLPFVLSNSVMSFQERGSNRVNRLLAFGRTGPGTLRLFDRILHTSEREAHSQAHRGTEQRGFLDDRKHCGTPQRWWAADHLAARAAPVARFDHR